MKDPCKRMERKHLLAPYGFLLLTFNIYIHNKWKK